MNCSHASSGTSAAPRVSCHGQPDFILIDLTMPNCFLSCIAYGSQNLTQVLNDKTYTRCQRLLHASRVLGPPPVVLPSSASTTFCHAAGLKPLSDEFPAVFCSRSTSTMSKSERSSQLAGGFFVPPGPFAGRAIEPIRRRLSETVKHLFIPCKVRCRLTDMPLIGNGNQEKRSGIINAGRWSNDAERCAQQVPDTSASLSHSLGDLRVSE
jgi:CheY-like chemotaxis protein